MRYPVYVPSKGRWEAHLTVRALQQLRISHYVVIQPQEYDEYASAVDPATILVLPPEVVAAGKGSVPARNWIWEHSIGLGAARHWQLDDNISGFYRLNRNLKTKVTSAAIFRAAEDFVDRYENVAQAGFQYHMFAPRKTRIPPIRLNTRIYSHHLILNSLPHRFRGIYNEDTDLSLRLLKDGWCTVLFNAFLCFKMNTMICPGGNTGMYDGDGRLAMAKSLVAQHPDVTKIVYKWGRWQHSVDYRRFKKNRLRLRRGVEIPKGVDEYGMVFQSKADSA